MLGFSIQKLLFTVFIVLAVWYGFKWIGQMKIRRKKERSFMRHDDNVSSHKGFVGAEDMLECNSCGSFVAARDPRACGRTECPYPG